nr:MAG TPA: hypothetical protein [Microviridae sp.]
MHGTAKLFSKNLLTKKEIYGIMQTEREVRNMRAKSMNHLSAKALEKLWQYGLHDTSKYRYVYNYDNDKVYRIEKSLLDTTEALNPENWIEQ